MGQDISNQVDIGVGNESKRSSWNVINDIDDALGNYLRAFSSTTATIQIQVCRLHQINQGGYPVGIPLLEIHRVIFNFFHRRG